MLFSNFFADKMGGRIRKLGTAIFTDLSESVLKFPTSIIRVLSVDDHQGIWFEVPRPYVDISGMELAFPVTLHFYNKHCNYYVNVDGIAHIQPNLNGMTGGLVENVQGTNTKKLLIQVKMNYLEYSVRRIKNQINFYDRIIGSVISGLHNESSYYSAEN